MNVDLNTFQNLKEKTILVAGDHHAHQRSMEIYQYLQEQNIQSILVDYDDPSSDYITQTLRVAKRVGREPLHYAGIVGCRNGFGTTLMANKFPFVFAARCDNVKQAKAARMVNYANVLTFGSDFISAKDARSIVKTWLDTDYVLDKKNIKRISKIFELEKLLLKVDSVWDW